MAGFNRGTIPVGLNGREGNLLISKGTTCPGWILSAGTSFHLILPFSENLNGFSVGFENWDSLRGMGTGWLENQQPENMKQNRNTGRRFRVMSFVWHE
jgi:hypothetical protein